MWTAPGEADRGEPPAGGVDRPVGEGGDGKGHCQPPGPDQDLLAVGGDALPADSIGLIRFG
jgi:hypothetical protein